LPSASFVVSIDRVPLNSPARSSTTIPLFSGIAWNLGSIEANDRTMGSPPAPSSVRIRGCHTPETGATGNGSRKRAFS
jgi:hypothetical protein